MRRQPARAEAAGRKAAETAKEAAVREAWLKERLDQAQAEALKAQVAALTERLGERS